MKQCIALAGVLCLLASGCATTGKRMACGEGCDIACGEGCEVGCSDGCSGGWSLGKGLGRGRGNGPLLMRDGSRPGVRGVAGECCPAGCSLGGAFGCGPGACEPCGACDGCACGGPCQRLAMKIAGGGCAGVGGVCPTGTYPEYPAFNQGPPVGQAAYPYYTTRGPRDFLLNNPPHIGPY